MSKQHCDRKAPLFVLLLLLIFTFVLAGGYLGAADEANALDPQDIFPGDIDRLFTGLKIEAQSPDDNETGISLEALVSLHFNRAVNTATLNDSTFFMYRTDGPAVKIAATIKYLTFTLRDGTLYRATLTPNNPLSPNTKYTVKVTSGITSTTGKTLSNPGQWSFTTDTWPVPMSRIPQPDATGVPVDQVISMTFNKAMDASTFSSSSFYIREAGGSAVTAGVTLSSDKLTAFLTPVADLKENKTYEVTLTGAVKSETQVNLPATMTWTFTTTGGVPHVTTKTPTDGSSGVPVGQVVSAVFDKDMDASTITEATFYLKKSGGTPLPASVSYSAGTRTASLDPIADLEAGATYEVTLTAAIEGANSLALAGAPVSWSFTTASGGGGGSAFSDIAGSPYATAITALADDGVVTGFEDGTFKPNNAVTRQQFAKMIVLALGLAVTGTEVCPFGDVPAQEGTDPLYPSKYVAVCAAQGITQGTTPTTFSPRAFITHQQLITMVVRAAGLSDPPAQYSPPFMAGQFSLNEHYLNARKAAYAGLLAGLVGVGPTYDFLAPSTRGECAQILYNMRQFMEL